VIFRKLIKRESSVIVAVEADDIKEANKVFEEWYNNDDNIESTSELLAEREKDSEDWLAGFNTWEEINRSPFQCADFIIEKKDKEPMYDLYIFEPAFDCSKPKYVNKNVNMEQLTNHLSFYDEHYKLTMKTIAYCFMQIDLNTKNHIMVFEAVKRDGRN